MVGLSDFGVSNQPCNHQTRAAMYSPKCRPRDASMGDLVGILCSLSLSGKINGSARGIRELRQMFWPSSTPPRRADSVLETNEGQSTCRCAASARPWWLSWDKDGLLGKPFWDPSSDTNIEGQRQTSLPLNEGTVLKRRTDTDTCSKRDDLTSVRLCTLRETKGRQVPWYPKFCVASYGPFAERPMRKSGSFLECLAGTKVCEFLGQVSAGGARTGN